MSLVSVQEQELAKSRELNKTLVHFRVKLSDRAELEKMALFTYEHGVIDRPSVNLLAKAALKKIYNEVNEKLARGESIDG